MMEPEMLRRTWALFDVHCCEDAVAAMQSLPDTGSYEWVREENGKVVESCLRENCAVHVQLLFPAWMPKSMPKERAIEILPAAGIILLPA